MFIETFSSSWFALADLYDLRKLELNVLLTWKDKSQGCNYQQLSAALKTASKINAQPQNTALTLVSTTHLSENSAIKQSILSLLNQL
jgi:hypothetical protein